MIYALDIKVYCNHQATLDILIGDIPPIEDSRVRDKEYEGAIQRIDDVTGHQLLTASIKFYDPTDRATVEAEILENQGLLNECEVGTVIGRRNSDHLQDISERQGCYYTVVFEVVE